MDTVAANRIVKPGDILDLSYKDARILVGLGKAIELADDTLLEEEVIVDGDEVISDQVRVRRRARKS